MDRREALKIAEDFVKSLSPTYRVQSAFLFGSYAKGNQNEDSDIDIALVLQDCPDILDAQIELMKLRRKFDLRIEPHPFLDTDFVAENPVVHEILKFGVEILPKAA
jgi:predicted nucleotidyltransferase